MRADFTTLKQLEFFLIFTSYTIIIKWPKGLLIYNIRMTNMNFSDALTSYTVELVEIMQEVKAKNATSQ